MNDPRIPVNIVTGFLGVGKTTAILSLLAARPGDEPWAVLVNEFGKVPIDQAAMRALGGDGMQIAEVAGGCLCCTAGVNMQLAMVQLIEEASPVRILIEPTGLGHPHRIRDILTGDRFATLLSPAPTLCLIDPRQFINPRFVHLLTYWEQIRCADVIVLNKTDLIDDSTLDACRRKLDQDYPEKTCRVEVTQGQVTPAWLHAAVAIPNNPGAETTLLATPGHHDHAYPVLELRDGQIRRMESTGLGRHACGWILDRNIVLVHEAIDRWLTDPEGPGPAATSSETLRVKGVLHTDQGWWVFNAVGDESTWHSVAPSDDSRMECISGEGPLDWQRLEASLLACVRA